METPKSLTAFWTDYESAMQAEAAAAGDIVPDHHVTGLKVMFYTGVQVTLAILRRDGLSETTFAALVDELRDLHFEEPLIDDDDDADA